MSTQMSAGPPICGWVGGRLMGRPASVAPSPPCARGAGAELMGWRLWPPPPLGLCVAVSLFDWPHHCGPGLLRSQCSFLRASLGAVSLAESRVGTVRVRSAGSRCGEREEASPPDLGSPGPHPGHRARLHWPEASWAEVLSSAARS